MILYDGVCGLCHAFVRFARRRDARHDFAFAPLQGRTARTILARHARDPVDLDTVFVVVDAGTPAERLLDRSDAALYVLAQLGGVWSLVASLLGWLPRRDLMYSLLARSRYRLFGRLDACALPEPEQRERFIEG